MRKLAVLLLAVAVPVLAAPQAGKQPKPWVHQPMSTPTAPAKQTQAAPKSQTTTTTTTTQSANKKTSGGGKSPMPWVHQP